MMCEATVYLRDGEKKEKVMEDVASIRAEGGVIVVTGILGERQEVQNARIVEVRMEPTEIYLQR